MFEQKVTTSRTFSICLGMDGGFFQIGGFTDDKIQGPMVSLPTIHKNTEKHFNLKVFGFKMGDHHIKGSGRVSEALIDSGATFTNIPRKLLNSINSHFEQYCEMTKHEKRDDGKRKYCPGFEAFQGGEHTACFSYDKDYFEGPNGIGKLHYFLGFPIIRLMTEDQDGKPHDLNWYPAEYFYKRNNQYCLTADKNIDEGEVQLGTTFMRQFHYAFKVDERLVSIGRAECSEDPELIVESTYLEHNYTLAL